MVAAATLVVASVAAAPNADAANVPVGVNGCSATSPGSNVPGVCTAVALPGTYFLQVSSTGYASASVDCAPLGGSESVSNSGSGYAAAFFDVPGGDCTLTVSGEVTASASVAHA